MVFILWLTFHIVKLIIPLMIISTLLQPQELQRIESELVRSPHFKKYLETALKDLEVSMHTAPLEDIGRLQGACLTLADLLKIYP